MSDPDFEPNFPPTLADDGSPIEANEADVIEQNTEDLSQTPEDVDESDAPRGYGDDAETELEDANDYDAASDYEEEAQGSDYDDE